MHDEWFRPWRAGLRADGPAARRGSRRVLRAVRTGAGALPAGQGRALPPHQGGQVLRLELVTRASPASRSQGPSPGDVRGRGEDPRGHAARGAGRAARTTAAHLRDADRHAGGGPDGGAARPLAFGGGPRPARRPGARRTRPDAGRSGRSERCAGGFRSGGCQPTGSGHTARPVADRADLGAARTGGRRTGSRAGRSETRRADVDVAHPGRRRTAGDGFGCFRCQGSYPGGLGAGRTGSSLAGFGAPGRRRTARHIAARAR